MFYEVYGTGEPAILLLPTWELTHSRPGRRRSLTLARHARVLTFDPRGNGRSDRPRSRALYAGGVTAADAVAVMDARRRAAGGRRRSRAGPARPATRCRAPGSRARLVFIAPDLPCDRGAALTDHGPPARSRVMPQTLDGMGQVERHYWLRDYAGFLDCFFAEMFNEPHSTKQIEDAIGWGLRPTRRPSCSAMARRWPARRGRRAAALRAGAMPRPGHPGPGDADRRRMAPRAAVAAAITGGGWSRSMVQVTRRTLRDPVAVEPRIRDFACPPAGRCPATSPRPPDVPSARCTSPPRSASAMPSATSPSPGASHAPPRPRDRLAGAASGHRRAGGAR